MKDIKIGCFYFGQIGRKVGINLKEWMQLNWKKVIGILVIAIATPNILGGLLNIPGGHLTIGDENAWVSFYGSYTGGIIGGIVALIIASTQLINERKKNKESQRSFLSAAKVDMILSETENVGRKKKFRIVLTEAYESLIGTKFETTYYSIIRYGGPDIIMNCEFNIVVGDSSNFEITDTIKVWVDFFEKDEEILIPLCSKKFKKDQQGTKVEKKEQEEQEDFRRTPFVKEIQALYETLGGEKMRFYQSEIESERGHYVVGDKEITIDRKSVV